jgi:hypothetical protein
MNWMSQNGVLIVTSTRLVMLRDPTDQKGFEVHAVQATSIADIPDVFSDDLPGLPLDRDVEFKMELLPGMTPISRRPYRMSPNELTELKV